MFDYTIFAYQFGDASRKHQPAWSIQVQHVVRKQVNEDEPCDFQLRLAAPAPLARVCHRLLRNSTTTIQRLIHVSINNAHMQSRAEAACLP
jgi:hypothetical protein